MRRKHIVKIRLPGCTLALCTKTKVELVVEALEVITADHDTVTKSKFFPSVTFDTHIPNDPNLGIFYYGDAHFGFKDSSIIPTSSVRQTIEIGWIIIDIINKSIILFISTDGREDRNHRIDRVQSSHL